MGRNLGPLNIKDSYEGLVQISGSQLTDGSGSLISNLEVTASYATTADASISASYAQTSTSASHALVADVALNVPATASYALYAEVAGFATSSLSASHALVSDLATTASYVENVVSASYAVSSSHSDISDFAFTATSASYAITATLALSASHANDSDTSISASHAIISDTSISSSYSTFSETSVSSSHALSSDTAISASYALTASYAENAGGGGGNLQETLTLGNSGSIDIILSASYLAYPDLDTDYSFYAKGGTLRLDSDAYNREVKVNFGQSNTDGAGQTSVVIGVGNTNGSANGGFVHGENNILAGPGYSTFIAGCNDSATSATTAAILGGRNHVNNYNNSVILGGDGLTTTETEQAVAQKLRITEKADISGSLFVTGSQYGLLVDSEKYEIFTSQSADSTTPNILIGAQDPSMNGLNTGLGINNVVIGSGEFKSDIKGIRDGAGNSNIVAGGWGGLINKGSHNAILGGGDNAIEISGSILSNTLTIYNAILGGRENFIEGRTQYSAILAGRNNDIKPIGTNGSLYDIVGGQNNTISGSDWATITGRGNTIYFGNYSSIIGGDANNITFGSNTSAYSAILGGSGNTITHTRSAVIGGQNLSTTKADEVVVPNLNISGSLTDSTGSIGTAGQVLSSDGVSKVLWTTSAGGAAFPYTGSADISGSLNVSGSQTGVLQDNEVIDIRYQPTSNDTTPNILIGYKEGAYSSTGIGNILIGTGRNGTSNDVNRFIDVNATFAFNNTIIGGANQFISGSASNRSLNTLIGGNNNAVGRNNLGVGCTSNIIAGGRDSDIFGGNYNGMFSGYNHNIYTSSLDTIPTSNVILGGQDHDLFGGDYNAFVGGYNNTLNSTKRSVIIGGYGHTITQTTSTSDFDSVIVGGRNNNIIDHKRSVVLGGDGLSSSKADEVTVPHLTISGSVTAGVYTLTDVAGTTTMDCSLGNFFTLAMPAGGSTTLTPSNIQAGQTINVKITQNATPSTIAFDASVDFEGGTAFAVSTGASEVDVMTFISFDGTTLQATGLKNFS